jgi:hypothetical protein
MTILKEKSALAVLPVVKRPAPPAAAHAAVQNKMLTKTEIRV